nr:MAG: hypothetical protein Ga0209084_100071411 [Lavidaviridae sp.]
MFPFFRVTTLVLNAPLESAGVSLAESMQDGKPVLVVSSVEPGGLAAKLSIQVGSVLYRFNQIAPPAAESLAWFDRMLTQLPYPRVFEFLHPILEARQIVFPPLWEKATAVAKPLCQAELYTDLERWSQSEDLVTRVLESIQVLTQKVTVHLQTFVASERFTGSKEVGKEVIELYFRLFDLLPFRRVPDTLFEVPLLARSSFPALYEWGGTLTESQIADMGAPELLSCIRPMSMRIKAYRNFIKLRTKTRRVKRPHPIMGMYNQLLTLFTRQYTRMMARKLKVYANSEYSLKARLATPLTSILRKQVQRALKLAIQRHDGGQNALRIAFGAKHNHFLAKLLGLKSKKLLEQKTVSVTPAHDEAMRRVLLGYSEMLTTLRDVNEVRIRACKQSLRIKDREVYLARVLSKQLLASGAYAEPLKIGCAMLRCEDPLDHITDLQNITFQTCRVYLQLHSGEGTLIGPFTELDSTRTRLIESRRALQEVIDSLPASSTPESSFDDTVSAPLKEFLYWYTDMRSRRATLQLAMHAVCSAAGPAEERPAPTFLDAWALVSLSPKRHEHTWGDTFCTECGEEKPEVESESEPEDKPETVIERYVEDLPNPFAIGDEEY